MPSPNPFPRRYHSPLVAVGSWLVISFESVGTAASENVPNLDDARLVRVSSFDKFLHVHPFPALSLCKRDAYGYLQRDSESFVRNGIFRYTRPHSEPKGTRCCCGKPVFSSSGGDCLVLGVQAREKREREDEEKSFLPHEKREREREGEKERKRGGGGISIPGRRKHTRRSHSIQPEKKPTNYEIT